MLDRRRVGGVTLTVGRFQECVDAVVAWGKRRTPEHVHFVNAYSIALADRNQAYRRILSDGVCFTDGVPVAWVGRRAYEVTAERWPRVYGPDVMEAVLAVPGLRHYLLGSTPETLTALTAAIERRWPDAQVVGSESPPFRALERAEQVAQDSRIETSGADLVWIGLGTPKQDLEAERIARSSGVTTLAVGAAFDFLAGTKRQAPLWMQRSGAEWAFRLATEPRRLAKRYLWGNPRFVIAVSKEPGFGRRRA